jgi:hypothetical protein
LVNGDLNPGKWSIQARFGHHSANFQLGAILRGSNARREQANDYRPRTRFHASILLISKATVLN